MADNFEAKIEMLIFDCLAKEILCTNLSFKVFSSVLYVLLEPGRCGDREESFERNE